MTERQRPARAKVRGTKITERQCGALDAGSTALATVTPARPEASRASVGNMTLVADGAAALDKLKAEFATLPHVPGTQTVKAYTDQFFDDGRDGASATAIADALRRRAASIHSNDMREAESTLVIQATSLDAIFNRFAFLAAQQVGTSLDGTERYLRLALKAQAQSARTLEVLAAMKNPTVFARQANVNMGGQQQVNNGVEPPGPTAAAVPRARVRTERKAGVKSSNELSRGVR